MTIEDYRRFYAEEVRYGADVSTEALVEAYERVPRERFPGPGPWQAGAPEGSDINNGRPTSLARGLDALRPPVRRPHRSPRLRWNMKRNLRPARQGDHATRS